ncbi:MAG: tRNA (adenosine(37)-N6)-threonylcarbamoyltransferase complex dimerization subunit type 1 TsaB [Firmicutes bacterium]|nr:tRNA (adenosine(37)-N6)-threonylcarbamoyltransferase complex dimerization subunit type 1 TsaB [Bacillota bacterium]
MNILIIDSISPRLLLAVIKGTEVFSFVSEKDEKRHSASILVAIDTLLRQSGLKINEISAICAVVGPGSFTGIRIGVSTATALATASGAKLISLTSLEPYVLNKDSALALFDCKNDNYYALYKNGKICEYLALNKAELNNFSVPFIYRNEPDIDLTVKAVLDKVKNGCFSPSIKPFYFKESSAEKNANP